MARNKDLIYFGNAFSDRDKKQWLMGYFRSPEDPLYDEEVEVKWATYQKGEKRSQVTEPENYCTLTILLKGSIKILFYFPNETQKEVVLAEQGAFILSRPGVRHTWETEEGCVAITVRWPSKRT